MKIRLVIAIDARGNWYACGGNGLTQTESIECALEAIDGYGPNVQCHHVEVDVPVPQVLTIDGKVCDGH